MSTTCPGCGSSLVFEEVPEGTPDAALRERILRLLKRHGRNSTSFQILEPGYRYVFQGEDACVAYVDTGGAWVVAGGPIAPTDRCGEVARAFCALARSRGRRVCFFGTEAGLCPRLELARLPIGEQPVWEPERWPKALGQKRSLREQLRRARAKGVAIRRLTRDELGEASPVRTALDRLITRWLASRAMPAMGFLVKLEPFASFDERVLLVAEQKGRVVGFAALVPVFARGGWFVEFLLRDPDAPNGTAELLFDAAVRFAADDGSRYLTLGLSPLSGAVGGWLRAARQLGSGLYDFGGLHSFKTKLAPSGSASIYVSYPGSQSRLATIYDVLRAFAQGGLLRFGLRTLLRGPTLVLQLLAVALVPWTLLLAAASTTRWFPSAAVKWAWVGFDVLLAVALLVLSRSWRPWLASTLAVLVSLDSALTWLQAVLYNANHLASAVDALVVALAVLAPTTAAVVLWGARSRLAPLADRPSG